jgi:hypothetical protein
MDHRFKLLAAAALIPAVVFSAWLIMRPRYDPQIIETSSKHGWQPQEMLDGQALARKASSEGRLSDREWQQVESMLRDPNQSTRTLGATALMALQGKPDQERGAKAAVLLLKDDVPSVRALGLRIVNMLDHPMRQEFNRKMLSDPSEEVQTMAKQEAGGP